MREKILAKLLALHAGLSKNALGLIADKLAKKVTEESGIDQAITDFDNAIGIKDFADDLQREADRRVTEAQKEWEKKKPTPPKADPPKTDDPPKPDDVPAWAKSLMDTVSTIVKSGVQTSLRSKAAELLKDVPESYWRGRALPEKEEDLQAFVDSINKDYGEFTQHLVDKGLMNTTPPAGGGDPAKPGGGLNEKKLDADIQGWAAQGKDAGKK